jgi:hypothetical protein
MSTRHTTTDEPTRQTTLGDAVRVEDWPTPPKHSDDDILLLWGLRPTEWDALRSGDLDLARARQLVDDRLQRWRAAR